MDSTNIYLIAAFVICFLTSFGGLAALAQTSLADSEKSANRFVFVILSLVIILGFTLFSQLAPTQNDFIFELDLIDYLLPFSGLILIAALNHLSWPRYFYYLSITALIVTFSLLLSPGFSTFDALWPLWFNKLLGILLWLLITLSFRYLNGINGFLGIQILSLNIGIFALSLLGGVPYLIGALSLIIAAVTLSFLIFNWYPSRFNLNNSSCDAFGFLLGWLILITVDEGAGSCAYIFFAVAIIEVIIALGKKASLRPTYQDIIANTFYYQSNISGLSPAIICSYYAKLNLIMLMLGCFQIYSPNFYSLPLFATIIIVWNLNRLHNWEQPVQSFREINREVYHGLKEQINNIKSNINKDDHGTDK